MEHLDKKHTAVLAMDCQNDIVPHFAKGDPGFVERAARVLDGARQAGLPVIHVVFQFRAGHPEIGARGQLVGTKSRGVFVEGTEGAKVHPALGPKPGDLVVAKRRVSAFAGSDLEYILKSRRFENLVLFGLATSGVVLSTVRAAADLDYTLTVVSDCCGDADPEVHRVLIEKVFPRQASVVTAEKFITSLKA